MARARISELIQQGRRLLAVALLGFGAAGLVAGTASAVPAFAVQTGAPCQACHVGGFGPQLTPFGRAFKLQGYTMRTAVFNLPLSAMAIGSFTHTDKGQAPTPGFAPNDNFALDQISLFFAGGFGQHIGAFVQTTYDGVARAWHWDNVDLRATQTFTVKGADVTVGATLNNSPAVEDAWNTLPAWGYPYTASALAQTPSASPLLNGALAQNSLGATAYAWIASSVYLEAGGYGSPGATSLSHLGVNPTDPGSIHGLAPYGRAAFEHDLAGGTLEVGVFGMRTDIFPALDHTTGMTDRYTDLGFDGSYIRTLKNTDVVSFNARVVRERQTLAATCALAGQLSGCASNTLTDVRADGSYYWRNKVGLTVALFDTTGSANTTIYAANRTSKPDSSGVTLQLDGTPFGGSGSSLGARFNLRVGLQYTAYARFDGAAGNYDGAGANASDNNTVRVFSWVSF